MKQILCKMMLLCFVLWASSLMGDTPVLKTQDWKINDVFYSSLKGPEKHRFKKYLKTQKDVAFLEMSAITPTAKTAFSGTFTLEFDFYTNKLPIDLNYYNPSSPQRIEIFQAVNQAEKIIMSLAINEYNRIKLFWRNSAGKHFSFYSTWNIKDNYEVAGILKNKWYKASIVRTMPNNVISLYLDGIIVGSKKFTGDFAQVKTLYLGSRSNKNSLRTFNGGITQAQLYKKELYNAASSKTALKNARKRLNLAAKKKHIKNLLPEDPSWSQNHPRLLLTPAKIEVLKAELEKGNGPKLRARFIAECSAMIDSQSPDYLKELLFRNNITVVTKPAMLCLATQLTGQKKFAVHAAKLVTAFVDKYGYHDHAHQLVRSVLMAKPILGVVLTYDWGYEYLTDKQKRKIRLFLFETAKGTYDYYKGTISDSSAKRDAMRGWVANWTALSISTLGNASLAILGETGGRVSSWLDYATFRSAQYGLFAIGMNGCFHEMPGYMAYGSGPLLIFMEALNTAGGDDLLKATNFTKFSDFLAYLILPANSSMMALKYSRKINSFHGGDFYILDLLKNKLKTASSEWCWQKSYKKRTGERVNLFNIIWFKTKNKTVRTPKLPLAKWFKSEGFAAFRSSWIDKNAIAGILMAYPAKIMAHDQCDRGQFTLYGFQGSWIIDSGGRAAPEAAYRSAHNLITIDKQDTIFKPIVLHNHHHDSFLTGFCHADETGTIIEADLTASYRYIYNWRRLPVSSSGKVGAKDDFKKAVRKLLLIREKSAPNYLLVYDEIQKDDTLHSYTLNLHTASENEVKIEDDKVKFYKYPQKMSKVSTVYRPLNKDGSRRFYYSGNPKAGYAEYIVNIPKDGIYNLYGFGHPGQKNPGGMDSFIVKLGKTRMSWGVAAYSWGRINKKPLALKKGRNTLTLLIREPETRAIKFAIFPHLKDRIPLFNKPNQQDLIIIDAGKPSKITKGFLLGKETLASTSPEAFMTLFPLSPNGKVKKEVFPGTPLNHFRTTITTESKNARFLNLFYPYKKDMEIPHPIHIADNIFSVKWANCKDIIAYNKGKVMVHEEFQTDADLIFVRMKKTEIISFALVNGTYLKYKEHNLIKLHGGRGSALWSNDSLAISGRNVYNFEFKFPSKSGSLIKVKAQNRLIKVKKTGELWQASIPFDGENILTW